MSRLREEQGFTLVEGLVTVTLLAVIVPMLLGIMLGMQRTAGTAERRLENVEQLRRAISAVTRDVRTAVRIPDPPVLLRTALPNDLWFHASTNPDPDGGPYLVRFFVRGDELVQQRTPPTPAGDGWTYQPQQTVERVLTTNLTSPAPFAFRCGGAACTLPVDPNKVTAISVSLSVRDPASAGLAPIEAHSTVRLVNNLLLPPSQEDAP